MSNLDAIESVEGDTMGLAGESNTMRMSDTPGDDEHMVAAEEVTESQTEEESNIGAGLFNLPAEEERDLTDLVLDNLLVDGAIVNFRM